MDMWLRVVVGLGVGLLGVGLYIGSRLWMELDHKASGGTIAGLSVIAIVGLFLASVGDMFLEPVTVAPWLAWTLIGILGFAAVIAFVHFGRLHRRLSSSDGELLFAYGLSMFLTGLTMVFALEEAF
jgi:ABC-type multidrug transport system permease subunit